MSTADEGMAQIKRGWRMNAREMAEKVYQGWLGIDMSPKIRDRIIDDIAAAIEEAEEQAARDMRERAAKEGENAVRILLLQDTPRYDGDDGHIVKRTVEGFASAIRALPLREGRTPI